MSQPKYHNFTDVATWPNGTTLEGIQGYLVKLFQRKTGGEGGQYGPWSLQGGELKDEHGNSMEITFKDQELIPDSWKNQWIIFTSQPNDKGKLCGLTIDDFTNQNKGTTTRRIKITAMARVDFANGQPSQPAPQRQGHQQGQQRPQNGPGQQSPRQAPAQQQQRTHPQQAPQGPKPIHGQTVGMAVKGALDIIEGFQQPPEYYDSPDFPRDIHKLSSAIIRVSLYLEKGNLAPRETPAPEPRQQPPAKQTPPPPPPPQESYGHPSDGMDDEIPF